MIFPKITNDSITVEWSDLGNKAQIYMVDLQQPAMDAIARYAVIRTSESSRTSHNFSGLQADTVYDFKITVFLRGSKRVTATGQARTLAKAVQTLRHSGQKAAANWQLRFRRRIHPSRQILQPASRSSGVTWAIKRKSTWSISAAAMDAIAVSPSFAPMKARGLRMTSAGSKPIPSMTSKSRYF